MSPTILRRKCLVGGKLRSQFMQLGSGGLQPISYMKYHGRRCYGGQVRGRGLFSTILKHVKPHIRPLAHKAVDMIADRLGGKISSSDSILASLAQPRRRRR